MKLLICTQIVDDTDPALGFFVRWIEEFSRQGDSVTVICLKEGHHNLPDNVKVLSLGKEEGTSRLTYLKRFYSYIFKYRHDYDSVLVHMNPEYVILGGFFWRLWSKKVGLWYTHKSVNLKLRLALLLTNYVFTASPESFRLKSPKVIVTGHGIDTTQFPERRPVPQPQLRLLTVGRFSKSKNFKDLFKLLDILEDRGLSQVTLDIVGGPVTLEDEKYRKKTLQFLVEKNQQARVQLIDSVSHANIPRLLLDYDYFVNTSKTGSLDKAVLEAMAGQMLVFTTNEGLATTLADFKYGGYFSSIDDVADELIRVSKLDPETIKDHGQYAREIVTKGHSLQVLVEKIIKLQK